jgi:hypothetical protein
MFFSLIGAIFVARWIVVLEVCGLNPVEEREKYPLLFVIA